MIPFGPLSEGVFIRRPNRFLLECRLVGEDHGEVVEAHLADPGRLKELLLPETKVWLRKVDNPKRKTKWSAVLCQTPADHGFVSLEAVLANRLVGEALQKKTLGEFADWNFVRREYSYASSRWDFLLGKSDGQQLILEVKSVTLSEDGRGMFPDAVTARGRRHVMELAEIAQESKFTSCILFVAQRSDIKSVEPAEHIDPKFADALRTAKGAGVHIYARKCKLTLEGITLEGQVPVFLD